MGPTTSPAPSSRRRRILALAALLAAAVVAPRALWATAHFDDVSDANVHHDSIEWISRRLITFGCDIDSFCPGDEVRRDQLASFLHRLAGETTAAGAHVYLRSGKPSVSGFNNVNHAEVTASADALGIVTVDVGFHLVGRTIQCTPAHRSPDVDTEAIDRLCTVVAPDQFLADAPPQTEIQVANYDISTGQLVPGDFFLTVSG